MTEDKLNPSVKRDILAMLEDGVILPNSRDSNHRGVTQFMRLVANIGDVDVIKKALELGADASLRDDEGGTALDLAVSLGNKGAVKIILMEGNAPINNKDKFGRSPLFFSARHAHPEIMKMLLLAGADINIINEHHDTPLHAAVFYDHFECVQILVENKADINIANSLGCTPIMLAAALPKEIRFLYTRFLLDNGANPNMQDKDGMTSLTIAAGVFKND